MQLLEIVKTIRVVQPDSMDTDLGANSAIILLNLTPKLMQAQKYFGCSRRIIPPPLPLVPLFLGWYLTTQDIWVCTWGAIIHGNLIQSYCFLLTHWLQAMLNRSKINRNPVLAHGTDFTSPAAEKSLLYHRWTLLVLDLP